MKKDFENVLSKVKEKDVKSIYLVGSGGSNALLYPVKYLLDIESKNLNIQMYNADELVHRNPNSLNESSVVILTSRSGETPETVKAATYAREKGALTIGVIEFDNSSLGAVCEFAIKYGWIDEVDAIDGNIGVLYQLSLGITSVLEGSNNFDKLVNNLARVQQIADNAKSKYDQLLNEFAEEFKDEKVIYTLASGASYGAAYSFAICTLMEMQWINSQAIHSGEYFHGPFEIVEADVPVIQLIGLDRTRPMDERAFDFTSTHTKKLMVLDAKDMGFEEIDEDMRGYLAPLVFTQLLWKFAYKLADYRGHPMFTSRRYMTKIEY